MISRIEETLTAWMKYTPYLDGAKIHREEVDTGFVDATLTMPNSKEYLVRVKVDNGIAKRTKNIGFDLVEQYTWKDKPVHGWLTIDNFLSKVTVHKFAPILNNDYHIIVKGIYKGNDLDTVIAFWCDRLREEWDYIKQNVSCKAIDYNSYNYSKHKDNIFFVLPLQSDIIRKAILRKGDLIQ